jgi:general secretion pathway protein G
MWKSNQLDRQRSLLMRLRHRSRGFTLLELMIVITIVLILMTIAIPRVEQSTVHAKEAALKQDLSVMRQAIQNYTLDKEQAPQSLDDLVTAGYISAIPVDPITNQKDWDTESSDVVLSPDQQAGGLSDVHSSASGVSPFDGSAYSSW